MNLVVDSSALIAILFGESDAEAYRRTLANSEGAAMSAINLHESRIVASNRFGPESVESLNQLLRVYAVSIAAFDDAQAAVAFEAFTRFGKGRHRARLNLADCAAYALARSRDLPLLFKGADFALTDVTPAL